MDRDYIRSLHPVTAVLQMKVLSILEKYDIKTLLDVGGEGRLRSLSDYDAFEANINDDIDGCDLPYDDNSFDATVSIATLEHVADPVKFLKECYRVAKRVSIHWFPYGENAKEVEALKKKYGHWHPCRVPKYADDIGGKDYVMDFFMDCGEHLLLCQTLTPSLKNPEVYQYVVDYKNIIYGAILIGEK